MMIRRIALLLLLVLTLPLFADESKKRNILVMHSYHQGLEWTDKLSRGILDVLEEDGGEYEVFFEYLDTKRNPGEEYFRHLSDFERRKTQLAELDFDIIISSDNDALRFLVDYGEELFGSVPTVFCGVNNFSPDLLKGRAGITGIPEFIDYEANFRLMEKLHPERDRILVIADRTFTGNMVVGELQALEDSVRGPFSVEYLRDFSVETIGERIRELANDYLIYLLVMNSDMDGVFISYANAVKLIRQHSKVPIYGSWDFFFGKGVLGGIMVSGYSQGEEAAKLALRILGGEDPSAVPVEFKGINRSMFDYKVMREFDVDISRIPEDSLVINRPEPVLVKYRISLIVVGLVTLIFSLVFILYNGVQRRKKRRLEEMNRALDERVRQAVSELKTLSGLLPICSRCRKIRDDSGAWSKLEIYVREHTDADFSHGLCPDCAAELFPDYVKKDSD